MLEKLKRAGLRPEGASHEGDLRLALEEGADVKLSGDVRLDGARALRDRLTAALTALGGGALPGYADALEDTPGSRRVVVRGTSAGTRDLLLEPTRQGVRVWLEIAEPGAPLGSVLAAIGSYAEIPLTARRS